MEKRRQNCEGCGRNQRNLGNGNRASHRLGGVSLNLGYRPLVFMWIAEYIDGTALPQFDPETGKENLFKDVDHSKLKHFGWYPFTPELAQKVYGNGILVTPKWVLPFIIELKKGQKLIAHRTNTIKLHMRSGEIEHGETVYVLGVEGGKIMRIKEDGTVE